ncbi:glycoside hydrolase family 9 protein [Microbulbifer agarilyticus]|uniref:glycoside hydrolase family 9 protein n=1 Tax=Microbulbifer agarilyticus TaxID=260552 RepID=UPI001CD3449B|nr:glycoside hydrolase family 9 protein [Microbulbifer agarilyticus]MCA0894580.1 glycoside hydrolase family 9 protein [Microbulbifer agarilyticus]
MISNTRTKALTFSLWMAFAGSVGADAPAEKLSTTTENPIRMNQLGFLPAANKLAVVLADSNPGTFVIWDLSTDEAALRGRMQASKEKTLRGTQSWRADFSAIQTPGTYAIEISEGQREVFQVGSGLYDALADASLKAFYFQRASMPIEEHYAGIWARPAGHADDKILIHSSAASAERPAGTVVSAPKGWYDAGDYNKYVVNSGITMGTLMSAYERFPEYFSARSLNIPESENGLPDILDEVRYNLDWLTDMQDPNDGGVYHKLTTANFEGMVAPHLATKTRYMVQKGTAATLDFAAVMAQAARVFAPFEPRQAAHYLNSARAAWQWAEENPAVAYRQDQLNQQFDPDIVTGAYGDKHFTDEHFWAAAELFLATGEPQYWKIIRTTPTEYALPSWGDVRWLGYYSLLANAGKLPKESTPWQKRVADNLVQAALDLTLASTRNAYRSPISSDPKHFVWGSNSVAANQGILLLEAFRITGNADFLRSAEDTRDYLLGRNATGYSFVTGFGIRTPQHPHHRLTAARPELPPLPGFLVGGPNPGQHDGCNYPSDIADESFVDHVCSFASNEIAINWNAPFAYLINGLHALESQHDQTDSDSEDAH